MARINEDIRFYEAGDPYYYEVDNLPLQDLLTNDKVLQTQIDDLVANKSFEVGRSGFSDLKPYVNNGSPGVVFVQAGNFVGRSQRSSGATLDANSGYRVENGLFEVNNPPTSYSESGGDGDYSVAHPPSYTGYTATNEGNDGPGRFVGRTSVFQFQGGSVSIDAFDFNDFKSPNGISAPLARIDVIGITTVNGAMDDMHLPNQGNSASTSLERGDGEPKLAVVKGAGILYDTPSTFTRELVVGERFQTFAIPQENYNTVGRDFNGVVVSNPAFQSVPGPDDVANICVSRSDISQSLTEWAVNNQNKSFFLPIAYVYVPQTFGAASPIPPGHLKDIRPFFRTAELSLQERQSIAASVEPSVWNPVVTHKAMDGAIDDLQSQFASLQSQIDTLQASIGDYKHYGKTEVFRASTTGSNPRVTNNVVLPKGTYLLLFQLEFEQLTGNGTITYGLKDLAGNTLVSNSIVGNNDNDCFGTFHAYWSTNLQAGATVQGFVEGGGGSDSRHFVSGDPLLLIRLND
jgi:hypothetical protein